MGSGGTSECASDMGGGGGAANATEADGDDISGMVNAEVGRSSKLANSTRVEMGGVLGNIGTCTSTGSNGVDSSFWSG